MIESLVGMMRRRWRRRRMRLCFDTMRPYPDARILDVGGTPQFWADTADRDVTLLNLPQIAYEFGNSPSRFGTIVGDICRLSGIAGEFDLLLSNSVLEHVGSSVRQRQYAEAVRRAPAYWIQVPAPSFPIEVHCRVPCWWLLPFSIRLRLIRRWRRSGRIFAARQMAGTRPIHRRRLQDLFPDATIITERFLGFPKSYYAWRTTGGATSPS